MSSKQALLKTTRTDNLDRPSKAKNQKKKKNNRTLHQTDKKNRLVVPMGAENAENANEKITVELETDVLQNDDHVGVVQPEHLPNGVVTDEATNEQAPVYNALSEFISTSNPRTIPVPITLTHKQRLSEQKNRMRNKRLPKAKQVEAVNDAPLVCDHCHLEKPKTCFSKSQLKKNHRYVCTVCAQRVQMSNDRMTQLKKAFLKQGIPFDLTNVQKYWSGSPPLPTGVVHECDHTPSEDMHNSTTKDGQDNAVTDKQENTANDEQGNTVNDEQENVVNLNTTLEGIVEQCDENDYNDPMSVECFNAITHANSQ